MWTHTGTSFLISHKHCADRAAKVHAPSGKALFVPLVLCGELGLGEAVKSQIF